MPRASKPCACTGCQSHLGQPCPEIVPSGTSRCEQCNRQAETRRGTARQRGYDARHERGFRAGVLRDQPYCVCGDTSHEHHSRRGTCYARATVADHWPRSRRELVAAGENPNDPKFGRGLCKRCHDKRTAVDQPGGWNVR